MMPTKPYLLKGQVDGIAAAAQSEAQAAGYAVTIAVVDEFGALLRLDRLDGAPPVSLRVAEGKAHSSAHLRLSTRTISDMLTAMPSLMAIPGLFPFPGGLPIMIDGICVGAIGVSGAQGHEDEQVAIAGLAALG